MPIVTVQDLREEGLTVEREPFATDERLRRVIRDAEQYIERITRMFFEVREYGSDDPLILDGSGGEVQPVPYPIVRLDSVTEDGRTYPITSLSVYGSTKVGDLDDRFNPKLVKRPINYYAQPIVPLAYEPPRFHRAPRWTSQRQGVVLTGAFGFVEEDGGPPSDLRTAMLLLVKRTWRPLFDPRAAEDRLRARVASESTDGHSYSLHGVIATAGPTGDPDIDDVLARYTRRYIGSTRRA